MFSFLHEKFMLSFLSDVFGIFQLSFFFFILIRLTIWMWKVIWNLAGLRKDQKLNDEPLSFSYLRKKNFLEFSKWGQQWSHKNTKSTNKNKWICAFCPLSMFHKSDNFSFSFSKFIWLCLGFSFLDEATVNCCY